MRLLSFSHEGRSTFGAVVQVDGNDRVVDLGERLDGVRDLSDLLAQDRLDDARAEVDAAASSAGSTLPLSAITFLRTIPRPGKIFCIGVNYGGRNAEYRDGQEEATEAERVRPLPEFARRPRAGPRPATGERPARLRGRDRGGHRHGRTAHPRGPCPPAHRRPHPRQRGHDPRLGAARQVQRHAGQELGVVRIDRARGW